MGLKVLFGVLAPTLNWPSGEMSLTEYVPRELLTSAFVQIWRWVKRASHLGQFGVGANIKGYLVGRAVYLGIECCGGPSPTTLASSTHKAHRGVGLDDGAI